MLSLTWTCCLWGFIYGLLDRNSSLLLIIFSISLHVLCNIIDLVLVLLAQSKTLRSKLSHAVRFLAKSSKCL